MNIENANWKCREEYPDLSKASVISFDVETCDPNIETKGPGSIRKDGFICGFSVATDDGFKGYYPIRHDGGGNVENKQQAIKWFGNQLKTDVPKIGANVLYDCEWIKCDLGFDVKGKLYDVQVADPLIDENYNTYKLDALAQRWLGLNKEEELLYIAGRDMLKIHGEKEEVIKKVKGQLWRLPANLVGPYGEADATLPIDIFRKQEVVLKERGLWDIFMLECDVLQLLLQMRFLGIPLDIEKAQRLKEQLEREYDDTMRKIRYKVGFEPNIWAAEDIVKAATVLDLRYPFTDKGNPSFKADWLASQDHPLFKLILEARQLNRCGAVFIEDKILGMAVNGRLYPSYYQVKSDRGGTVGGRFSSSNPNAQQFPSRNERLATLVRSIITAEPGAKWAMFDYSQQEPRVTVHYAHLLGLPGADMARERYINNPDTDYHQMVSDWTGIDRKTAKTINLGLAYGMGPKKYSEMYGKTYAEAKELFNLYHRKLPYIRALSSRCESTAKFRGHVKTLLGRHCHFNLYGPPKWSEGIIPKRKEEAIAEFGYPVMPYFTYRAMNRVIQGSSADMIKQAMIDCWRAGYVCNLTVHDELDFANITSDKQIKEIKEIMLNCVKLEVPLKLDVEVGDNWGECEDWE